VRVACGLTAAALVWHAHADAQGARRQHGAHAHGVSKLEVAVDGRQLVLRLEAPAEDVVGFEHAPRDDGQRAAVAAAEKLLRAHAELFAMPPPARCRFVSAEVASPWAGHAAVDGEHADFAARWEFDCAEPAQLAFLEVRIAARLRGDLKLRAIVLDDRGQRQAELTRSRTRLALR
jgi:hypothetical protein